MVDKTPPTPMPDKKTSIFLSYARTDNEFALRLAQDLRAAGMSLWVDQFDIEPGQPWDRAVEQALKQSPVMLVVISSASIQSENVLDEISFAIETKKRIVPILSEKCDLPFRIRRIQYVDFTQDYDQGIARCLAVLSSQRENDSPSSRAGSKDSYDDRDIAQEAKVSEVGVPRPSRDNHSHTSTMPARLVPTHDKARWIFFGGLGLVGGALVGFSLGTVLGFRGDDPYVMALFSSLSGAILGLLISTKNRRSRAVVTIITVLSIVGWGILDQDTGRDVVARMVVLGSCVGAVVSLVAVYCLKLWDRQRDSAKIRGRDTGRAPK